MTIRQLDNIDLRILTELQHNGRATFQQLSQVVGVSARPCLERVRHLERERIITGYTTHVDIPRLMNVMVVAMAQMFVKQGREIRARFEQRMRACPEVIECFEVSGNFNYIAKIACPTLAHYQNLINGWIDDPSLQIKRMESDIVLQTTKDLCVYPIELTTLAVRRPRRFAVLDNSKKTRRVTSRQVDELDLRILAALQRDGRATFKELSEQMNLSSRACLERVRRLERNRIITNYAARVDLGQLTSVMVAVVYLHVTQTRQARISFEQHMRNNRHVLECFEMTGKSDYVVKVICSSIADYQDLTDSWTDDTSLCIKRIEGSIVLHTPKDNGLYPLDISALKTSSLRERSGSGAGR